MNNRIFELAARADAYADTLCMSTETLPDGQTWTTLRDEKFAELIVRECLFIIDDERKPDMVNRTELWHQIVEHFGVK